MTCLEAVRVPCISTYLVFVFSGQSDLPQSLLNTQVRVLLLAIDSYVTASLKTQLPLTTKLQQTLLSTQPNLPTPAGLLKRGRFITTCLNSPFTPHPYGTFHPPTLPNLCCTSHLSEQEKS